MAWEIHIEQRLSSKTVRERVKLFKEACLGLVIKADSLNAVKLTEGKPQPPWRLHPIVKEIKNAKLISELMQIVACISREWNGEADFLMEGVNHQEFVREAFCRCKFSKR